MALPKSLIIESVLADLTDIADDFEIHYRQLDLEDPDDEVTLTSAQTRKVINRLKHDIKMHCHAMQPDKHSSVALDQAIAAVMANA